jgi:hypothetical protein
MISRASLFFSVIFLKINASSLYYASCAKPIVFFIQAIIALLS